MLKTLVLAGNSIAGVHSPGEVHTYTDGWEVPGHIRYPANAGITGTVDIDVPNNFSILAYTYDGNALVATGWAPPTQYAVMKPWDFTLLLISVIGQDRVLGILSDANMKLLDLRLKVARDIVHDDVLSVWAGLHALSLMTQAETDQVDVLWPRS